MRKGTEWRQLIISMSSLMMYHHSTWSFLLKFFIWNIYFKLVLINSNQQFTVISFGFSFGKKSCRKKNYFGKFFFFFCFYFFLTFLFLFYLLLFGLYSTFPLFFFQKKNNFFLLYKQKCSFFFFKKNSGSKMLTNAI